MVAGMWGKKILMSCLCVTISFFAYGFATEPVRETAKILQETIGTVTFEGNTLVDNLINYQDGTKMKRSLILHFCDTILHKEHAVDGNTLVMQVKNYLYDPRQSLFVYTMCVNIDEQSNGRSILNEPYTYRNYKELFEDVTYSPSGVEFNLVDFLKEDVDLNNDVWHIPKQEFLDAQQAYSPCNPVQSMQACSFASFLPKIFETIINEYGNLKLGSLYGYQMIEAEKTDQLGNNQIPEMQAAVARFSQTFFADDTYDNTGKPIFDPQTPCNNPSVTYLDPNDPSGNSIHCNHPQTYEFVANTLKSAKRLIEKTVLIDGPKLMQEECSGNERNMLHMKCGFSTYGSTSFNSDKKSFNNLLLNELMWYNLFVTYYTQILLFDASYQPLTIGSASFSYQRSVKEYTTMIYEQQLAMQAIRQMNRMIHQVAVHYPIHVGLSAYYEDIVNFRKTITKSYTPFHQLAYKWRNVQACSE